MSGAAERATGQLRITMFGDFSIERVGETPLRVTRSVRHLLAYLLLGRDRNHSRDVIVDLFWRDFPARQGRSCLNTTLWRLRRLLEPEGVCRGTYLVCRSSGDIRFNVDSDHWLDVAVLDEAIRVVQGHVAEDAEDRSAENLRAALSVYSGELLEDSYDDWALAERERYRSAFLSGQAWLMRFYQARSQWDRSAECARQILRIDPLREEVHRDLIRVLLRKGQRAEAIRQYECCRRLLDTELGVEPMPETQELVAVRSPLVAARPATVTQSEVQTLEQALIRLRKAEQDLALARRGVEAAAGRLTNLVGT